MQSVAEPLVSIVALNYNNYDYVLDTLESISNQTYRSIELIIVDDFSTDNGLRLIEEWLPKCSLPVRVIKHEKNLGVCSVCNSGLSYANGKYIAMLATDDVLYPDRIKRQVELLEESSSDVCGIYSDMTIINEKGAITGDSFFSLIQADKDVLNELFDMEPIGRIAFLIKKNVFPAPSMMYKKEYIVKVGGWDEKLFFEDLDMNLRLTRAGYKFLWSEEKLVQYRYTQVSMSRKPSLRFLESHLAAINKYRHLSPVIDNAIKEVAASYAEAIYKMDGKTSSYWLRERLTIRKDKRTFLLLLASLAGIKYSILNKIKITFNYDS